MRILAAASCVTVTGLLSLGVIPIAAQGRGFIPGDRTIVTLDIAGTPAGGTPTGFRVLRGGVEAVDKDGTRMLRVTSLTELLIQLPESLPENFTVEFDLIPKHCCSPEDLSFEGTPTLSRSSTSAQLLWWQDAVRVIGGGGDYQAQMPSALRDVLAGQLSHVAVSFEGTTIRMYTNGERLYTLSDRRFARGRVLRVVLGGQDADQQAVYLAGLRIAVGGGPTATLATGSNRATTPASLGGLRGASTPTPLRASSTGIASRTTAMAPFMAEGVTAAPSTRTITLQGFAASGSFANLAARTIPLSGFSAIGSSQTLSPRTIPLSGFSAIGSSRTLSPRTIPLSGFSAIGSSRSLSPRTIPLPGFSAIGGFTTLSPRTIVLPGWTVVGVPR